MENLNNVDFNILNEELKRLHELLNPVVADETTRNRVLDMIENLHKANFGVYYFIPKGEEIW